MVPVPQFARVWNGGALLVTCEEYGMVMATTGDPSPEPIQILGECTTHPAVLHAKVWNG